MKEYFFRNLDFLLFFFDLLYWFVFKRIESYDNWLLIINKDFIEII